MLTPRNEMSRLLCRSLRVRASSSWAIAYPPAKVILGATAAAGLDLSQLLMAASPAAEAAVS